MHRSNRGAGEPRIFQSAMEGGGAYNQHARHQTVAASVAGQFLERAVRNLALERGAIDAAEWVGPYDDEKLGINKVAKFYYYPGWWEGGTALHLIINSQRWNELPNNYQAIVAAAAGFANVEMQGRYDARNPPALKRLVTRPQFYWATPISVTGTSTLIF
jgi:hypothetical protein